MGFLQKLQETLDEEYNLSITENGAIGYRKTDSALLDINFMVTSMRNMLPQEIENIFTKAYYEDPLLAIKWIFYSGDVREGLGERRLFRILMTYLANNHIEQAKKLIDLIPFYTRWDNLLPLLNTDLAENVLKLIKNQLEVDIEAMRNNKNVSLLAKWLPSINASSETQRKFAKKIINFLGFTQKQYRKTLAELRRFLDVVEVDMSSNNWDKIVYENIPSRANLIYNVAFLNHDKLRREEYLKMVEKGETTINAGVLFPHDIVAKYILSSYFRVNLIKKNSSLEALWKALPNYVDNDNSTICVSDGSGSMYSNIKNEVSPICVATAMAIYFAERCSGEFKNKYITFSENPKLVDLSKGKSLHDKLEISFAYNEVANTNIEAVFELILDTAVKNKMTQSDLPKNILILSDMEFDNAVQSNILNDGEKLFKTIGNKFAKYGYRLPRLIFWNINSRTNTIPLKENKLGVALVSGFSPTIVKMVLSNELDPFKCLIEQLNNERYKKVEYAFL